MRSAGSFLKKDMKDGDARSRQLPGALVISGVLPGEQTRVGGLPRMIYGSETKA
jgi:hypothetical protein